MKRLYHVDWLRNLVVLTLIPYHIALTYTGWGDTYVLDLVNFSEGIFMLIFTRLLDGFFMTLLFFLSGIGAYDALKKRDSITFIKERFTRLLIPLVLGTALLAPIQGYQKALYEGYSHGFIKFLPGTKSTCHYWFSHNFS